MTARVEGDVTGDPGEDRPRFPGVRDGVSGEKGR
jgi:hypothetical protein